jgi:hypothetical protein
MDVLVACIDSYLLERRVSASSGRPQQNGQDTDFDSEICS